MYDTMTRLEKVSNKRITQIRGKVDKLEHCTTLAASYQLHQDVAWNMEQFMRDIREIQATFLAGYDSSILAGRPQYGTLLPNCTISNEGLFYRIRFDALLPFKILARCNLLCADLEEAIWRYIEKEKLLVPVFQTAVVVFCHCHRDYDNPKVKLADYDNLERKSVLDALVPQFIPDDQPRSIITIDMMRQASMNYTDILIMSPDAFKVYWHHEKPLN